LRAALIAMLATAAGAQADDGATGQEEAAGSLHPIPVPIESFSAESADLKQGLIRVDGKVIWPVGDLDGFERCPDGSWIVYRDVWDPVELHDDFESYMDSARTVEGVLSKDGRWQVAPVYDKIEGLLEGRRLGVLQGHRGMIDADGSWHPWPQSRTWKLSYGESWVPTGRLGISAETGCGYIDLQGRVVVPPVYEEYGRYSHGVAWVRRDRKWRLIDRAGSTVGDPTSFERIKAVRKPRWRGRVAVVELDNGLKGAVTPEGKFAIEPIYDQLSPWNPRARPVARGSMLFVRKGDRRGMLDLNGRWVVQFPPKTRKGRSIAPDDSVFYVELETTEGRRVGLMDPRGQWLLEPTCLPIPRPTREEQGEEVSPWWDRHCYEVHENRILIRSSQGKYGFMDLKGRWIAEPAFEHAQAFRGGLAPVCVEGKWGFIDEAGKWVVEPKFANAMRHLDGLAWVILSLGERTVVPWCGREGVQAKVGYVDRKGRLAWQGKCTLMVNSLRQVRDTWNPALFFDLINSKRPLQRGR
jgi:hypothetical protein